MEKGTAILRRREYNESLWIYFDTVRFLILEVVFSDFSEFELGPPFEVIKTGFCLFKCSATLSIFLHRMSSKSKCKFSIFFFAFMTSIKRHDDVIVTLFDVDVKRN